MDRLGFTAPEVGKTLPSLIHSSRPWVQSNAENSSESLSLANVPGSDPSLIGLMSFTILVPPAVPLLVQSSCPNGR